MGDLRKIHPLGEDPGGSGMAIMMMLWSPAVMRELTITRISLDPEACNGHTYRHRIDGGGLVSLYVGGINGRVITHSHLGHQSEARAGAWDVDVGVTWPALKRLGNLMAYHVKKRLATGKSTGTHVLPGAMQLASAGYELKWSTQSSWTYVAEPIGR